ncbi:hypothetical protein BSKO_08860 [Bryopsis sp. KO-2023]|nr:hypothetical protein BSKO_08860 [Bryopsis sp. KO-2023]
MSKKCEDVWLPRTHTGSSTESATTSDALSPPLRTSSRRLKLGRPGERQLKSLDSASSRRSSSRLSGSMASLKDTDSVYSEGGRSRLSRAPFATPDNLESAAVYLQSSLKSFGFSGRVNFLSSAPDDIANTFNCVHYLLEKFQREQGKNEDTSSEVKRLRNELQVGENVFGRLKKDLELRERDIGTMMIKERQAESAFQEQLAAVTRDREELQKKCNNLNRRQVQFLHEIRRKESEYERLQDKLRYYLAEKKREAKASMEIVGRLRQQSQTKGKGGLALDEDLLKRGGSNKWGRSNVKLDENLVKMIVRAYEDKQKDLTMENKDLRAGLNSLQREYTQLLNKNPIGVMGPGDPALTREYTQLLNTHMGPDMVPHHIPGGIVPVMVPKGTSPVSATGGGDGSPQNLGGVFGFGANSVSPRGTASRILARTPSASDKKQGQGMSSSLSAPCSPRDRNEVQTLAAPKAADIAEALKKRKTLLDPVVGPSESQNEALETGSSEAGGSAQAEISPKAPPARPALIQTQQTDMTNSPEPSEPHSTIESVEPVEALSKDGGNSVGAAESDQENKSTKSHGSNSMAEKRMKLRPSQVSPRTVVSSPSSVGQSEQANNSHPESLVGRQSKKFVWPPPSSSPPPPPSRGSNRSPTPPRFVGKLGKLPRLSKKPIPNTVLMTEEQLKHELRMRAQEVEEAVIALRAACNSMNPQDMRGVLEKRLHMELVMAANLAEQQEAIVNLALIGMEKAMRNIAPEFRDQEEDKEKLAVFQMDNLCFGLKQIIAHIPEDYVEDSLRDVVLELEEKILVAKEEYEDVKTSLLVANKKTQKLLASTESSTKLLNSTMSTIDKRSANLAHEQEYLMSFREKLTPDKGSPEPDAKKENRRQTWAEKAQNSDRSDPFDDFSDNGTPTTGNFTSMKSIDREDLGV